MKNLLFGLLLAISFSFSQDDDMITDLSILNTISKPQVYLFVDSVLMSDSYKLEGTDLSYEVKKMNNLAIDYFKKWQKETDVAKRENYGKDALDYYWKITIVDPTGSIKNAKNKSYTLLAFEKLAEMYQTDNNIKLYSVAIGRSFKNFNTSVKNHGYAATYFKSVNNIDASIYHLELWNALLLANDKNNPTKVGVLKTIARYYSELNKTDLAIEACDRALIIDPNASDVEDMKNNLIGDPSIILEKNKEKLKKNPADLELLAKSAKMAMDVEDYTFAIEAYTKLLKNEPSNEKYTENLIKAHFAKQNYKQVVSLGKNVNDFDIKKKVVESYVNQKMYKEAFNLAANHKISDESHFLKGLALEQTAAAAKDDGAYSKKDYEWRLIYRLSYIEYQMGGNKGNDRASKIRALMVTKGSTFLKQNRLKPQAGAYTDWFTWSSTYDKEAFALDQ